MPYPQPLFDEVPTDDGKSQKYKAVGKLKGKNAIITGGDSGIGRATAILFAMEGANSLIAYLPEEEAEASAVSPLWREEAGAAASLFFAGLMDETIPALDVRAADYADLYRTPISTENVRARLPTHPRIAIWGPLEARLQQAHVLILGSLNEGTWPEAADPGPWLNRPMRATLGMPAPEERIGRAAFAPFGVEPEYFTGVHPTTLRPLERIEGSALFVTAAPVGPVRLIDNVTVSLPEEL